MNAFQSNAYTQMTKTFTVDRKWISFNLTLTLSDINLDLQITLTF